MILNPLVDSPAVTPDLHLTAASRLRGTRERYTENRRRLVQLLADAARPLTIREVIDRGDGLPQSSVYRNLVVMERVGIVRRVVGTDEFARFELDEELTGHHHHVICSSCGAVRDFTTKPRTERALQAVADDASLQTGFALESHSLDLFGLCEACA